MKSGFGVWSVAFVLVLISTVATASPEYSSIFYETESLGLGRWMYVYHVENVDLAEDIQEFTIWFDHGLYADLQIETPSLLNTMWDEISYNPYEQPPLSDFDGYYDAVAQQGVGVAIGEQVTGFSVSFEWLGEGVPSAQRYEIIDPVSFVTLDSGTTTYIPEPACWLTFVGGCLFLRRCKR